MTVEYKGFVVSQSTFNWHIMIAKDGKTVLHTQCDKPKTEEELKEEVDTFIELSQMIEEGELEC